MLMIPPADTSLNYLSLIDGPEKLSLKYLGLKAKPQAAEQHLRAWLADATVGKHSAVKLLEAISWAYALKRRHDSMPLDACPPIWTALIEFLVSLATADDLRAVAVAADHATPEEVLVDQLARAELALTLAKLLPNHRPCAALHKLGQRSLVQGLTELLDADGMPHADMIPWIAPLLACWTRCVRLEIDGRTNALGARTLAGYALFVRNALRLIDSAGRFAFDRECSSGNKSVADLAIELSADKFNSQLAALATLAFPRQPKFPTTKTIPTRTKKAPSLPSPAVHCEEHGVAVLNRHWGKDRDRLAVMFGGRAATINPVIDLTIGGASAACGEWVYDISLDGRSLVAEDKWESVCWVSDEDVDYLEIEQKLSDGVRLQRHMVLARKDRFLLLADAVIAPRAGQLKYRGSIPLAGGIAFAAGDETCEAALLQSTRGTVGKPLAQVFPLELPEWRATGSEASLLATSGQIELQQSAAGQSLFAPLFFDLDPLRFRRRFTWRKLTVAESLTPVAADVAVGYRVAIGNEQWLIYRSLAKQSNRSVLGHNLSTETLIARFSKGEVTSIVEVET